MTTLSHAPPLVLRRRARLRDVLRGRAPVIGPRCMPEGTAGLVSPVEARIHLGIPYGDLEAEERAYLTNRSLGRDLGVILRTLIATLLSIGGGRHLRRPFIVAARIDNLSIDEALDRLMAPAPADRARLAYFVHPHALNMAAFDRHYAAVLGQGDIVLPDGVGIRMAAAIVGLSLRHNVNGTDLLPLLAHRAAEAGVPLVLLGAAPGVAELCAERLIRDHPGLTIPLVSHGYLKDDQIAETVAAIRQVGPAIVLVGMGSPRQEHFSARHLGDLGHTTVVTVGGLFDFFSGQMPRAPMAWRELGLEWLYRLAREPRRMARRYLIGNPLFLALAVRQRLLGRR